VRVGVTFKNLFSWVLEEIEFRCLVTVSSFGSILTLLIKRYRA